MDRVHIIEISKQIINVSLVKKSSISGLQRFALEQVLQICRVFPFDPSVRSPRTSVTLFMEIFNQVARDRTSEFPVNSLRFPYDCSFVDPLGTILVYQQTEGRPLLGQLHAILEIDRFGDEFWIFARTSESVIQAEME